jgi:hypothetical protein
MRIILNLIILVLVCATMLVISIVARWWIHIESLQQSFKVYFGWFDWGTIITWIPVILGGAIGSLCVILLISSDHARLWGLVTGAVMSFVAAVLYGSRIGGPEPIGAIHTSFLSIWPLMYFVGALVTSSGALKLKDLIGQLRAKRQITAQ